SNPFALTAIYFRLRRSNHKGGCTMRSERANRSQRDFIKIELKQLLLFLLVLVWVSGTSVCLAQRGVPASRATGFTLFGDVEVNGEAASDSKTLTFDLLLYSRSGVLLD